MADRMRSVVQAHIKTRCTDCRATCGSCIHMGIRCVPVASGDTRAGGKGGQWVEEAAMRIS